MSQPKQAGANRRASRRLPSRSLVKITCRKGSTDLGPNLAVALLDASETGVRLVLSQALDVGQEVSLTLDGPTGGRPAKCQGTVVWSVPAADGSILAGVRLHKPLRYHDLTHLTRF
jgi:hypothetical protein